jgi:hypothetical protein
LTAGSAVLVEASLAIMPGFCTEERHYGLGFLWREECSMLNWLSHKEVVWNVELYARESPRLLMKLLQE